MSDIENFLLRPIHSKCILLFPPVNKYRRFLIHKLIEESFSQKHLQTLSVGKDFGRRTAVFRRSLLRPDFKPPENNQLWKSSVRKVPMVNKNVEKSKPRTPYAGIYRPPAVRRLQDGKTDSKSEEPVTASEVSSNFAAPSPTPPCHLEKKSTRVKRPDQQMYVPRPKRLSRNDETTLTCSSDRQDKVDSPSRNKVFICEKKTKVKVRKKSADREINGINEEHSCEASSPETAALKYINQNPTIENVTSVPDLDSNYSIDESFCSLDNSLPFESSQSKSSECSADQLDSNLSFQTCTEFSVSISSENGHRHFSDIEFLDCPSSVKSSQQSSCGDKISSDVDSSNSVLNRKSPISCDNSSLEVSDAFAVQSILSETDPCLGSISKDIDDSCHAVSEPFSDDDGSIKIVSEEGEIPDSSILNFSSATNETSGNLTNLSRITNDVQFCSTPVSSGILDDIEVVEDENSPLKRNSKLRSASKSPEDVADDWELLLNESGQFLDSSLLQELEDAVGKVNISRPSCNYKDFQTADERTSDGECIIEIYGFSSELRTHDLMNIFSPLCGKNFQIAWVDDTHALGVFPSPILADELLSTELPFVKTRPLSEGIPESRFKARKLVLPPMTRPKTCPALARRLVTGALGLRLPTSKLEREAERKVLKEARDKKRQEAKIRRDIWEGN